MSAKVTLSTSIKTSENLISERVETILIDDSEQMYETASKLLLEAFNLNTAVSNPLRSLTSNDWSKNVEDTAARLTTELELIEDFKEAMEILEGKTENPFQEALESDDEWFKWFESDCITCSVKIHSDISQEEEEAILISLLKMDNFSFVNEPECYDSLSEHFNNEVLDLYERNNPDQVDEEGSVDYANLTDSVFNSLLSDIVDEKSTSVILGIDNIYSIVREKYSNKIYDTIQEKAKEALL